MSTLREAVREYLTMRRALGFKLHDVGNGLLDFATFMEQQRASYITQQLALKWAQQPPDGSAIAVGATIELCARLCALPQRHRSTDPDSARGFIAISAEAGAGSPLHE